jgi:hypothetical protein
MKATNITPIDNIGGTSLQGYINASFDELVDMFGEPHYFEPYTGDKVQCEWSFKTNNGIVFTIYDWKEYGTHPHDVTSWHIGGYDKKAELTVLELFQ